MNKLLLILAILGGSTAIFGFGYISGHDDCSGYKAQTDLCISGWKEAISHAKFFLGKLHGCENGRND